MSVVAEDRVPLILRWNEREIWLAPELVGKLDAIGRTPPDSFGNGRDYSQTPCSVLTKAGERLDLAVVSLQQHAPFEADRNYRLGLEIADVYPSPYALPLSVRVATAAAREAGQGFAPTPIEMTDGKQFVLNWQPDFVAVDGYRGKDARLLGRQPEWTLQPQVISKPDQIVYFIADG